MSGPDFAVSAIRAIALVVTLQAAGLVLFIALFGGRTPSSESSLCRGGALVAIAAMALTLADQLLGPARLLGEFSGLLDRELHALMWSSDAGVTVSMRLLGLLLVWSALIAPRRLPVAAGAGGAILVAVSFALVGHTANDAARWLLAPLLVVHVFVALMWSGALAGLWCAIRRESTAACADLLQRFTQIATPLVPLLPLTGLVLAWRLLPDLAAIGSGYGMLLLIKFGGFIALVSLAAVNKWCLVPRVAGGDEVALRRLGGIIVLEWLLLTAVLLVTAVMTMHFSPGS